MLFFPYRADLEHWRFPLVTLLICALCMLVYANQYSRKLQLDASIIAFCQAEHGREFSMSLNHIATVNRIDRDGLCMYMLRTTHNHENPEELLRQWAFVNPDGIMLEEMPVRLYIFDVFKENYRKFSLTAPTALTHRLWFAPDSINVETMLTSVFAHNDIIHLLGNLFFFFAFAATVELIIGALSMLASVALLAILTNLFYAFISVMQGVYVPTLGLSGIVFGMMGMFVCFLPLANVRCFLWFVIVFKRIALPAWLIALTYIGWNLFDWFSYGSESNVNFIVHIAGACFGYLLGVSVFRTSKRRYAEISTARDVSRRYALAQR